LYGLRQGLTAWVDVSTFSGSLIVAVITGSVFLAVLTGCGYLFNIDEIRLGLNRIFRKVKGAER
jgi:hypothetical protein